MYAADPDHKERSNELLDAKGLNMLGGTTVRCIVATAFASEYIAATRNNLSV